MGQGQEFYFGQTGETTIAPVVLCMLVFGAGLMFYLPRKYVIYPFLLCATLIPMPQVVVVGGLHFTVLRILICVGWVRVLATYFAMRTGTPMLQMTNIDRLFLAWVTSNVVMFTILWGAWGAFVNRLGFAYTDLGIYFLIRLLVRDERDVQRTIRVLAILCFVVGLFMLNEQLTGKNIFGMLGGVPQIVQMREGKLRAQGPFQHPLLAGAAGATLVPLFFGLWWRDRGARKTAVFGAIGASLMAITSMSSTSTIGLGAGLLALCLWPAREGMRFLRWGVVLVLVGLHLAMKAPVWALIGRIDLTGGSSGYHRYELINQAILRFQEWWLVGTQTQSNWGWDMWDSINWYVNEGTKGGLLTLTLFVAILVYSFKRIGMARKQSHAQKDRPNELFIWAMGSSLFANALSFVGIVYFDQSCAIWFAFLAMLVTATVTPARYKNVRPSCSIALEAVATAQSEAAFEQRKFGPYEPFEKNLNS